MGPNSKDEVIDYKLKAMSDLRHQYTRGTEEWKKITIAMRNRYKDILAERARADVDQPVSSMTNPGHIIPKCQCGAKHTSNPNHHLSWCDAKDFNWK